jgi:protein involved in polysaccharide export with SLBB domain
MHPTTRITLPFRPLRRGGLACATAAAALVASGCTQVAVSVVKPTPWEQVISESKTYEAQNAVYHLVPGDQLTVRFYFNPQLDEDLQVRPDGNISLSLIGEVAAAGKTPAQLSNEITQAYAQYFKKSTAVVIVRQFNMERVFVAGEVHAPGQFNLLTGGQTALQSIAEAGGVTDQGTLTHVILVRHLPGQPKLMVSSLDLTEALGGENSSQNISLMPNDMIYVPKSGMADFNLAIHQYLFNNLNLSTGASYSYSNTHVLGQ